jgi:hypothetical protein
MSTQRLSTSARVSLAGGYGSTGSWNTMFATASRQSIAWIRSEQRIRSSITELTTLDDRLLADSGVCRRLTERVRLHDRLAERWCYGDCQ